MSARIRGFLQKSIHSKVDDAYTPAARLSSSRAARLREMGLYMDLAVYDEESGRWERVPFSEEVADMLVELDEAGQLGVHRISCNARARYPISN